MAALPLPSGMHPQQHPQQHPQHQQQQQLANPHVIRDISAESDMLTASSDEQVISMQDANSSASSTVASQGLVTGMDNESSASAEDVDAAAAAADDCPIRALNKQTSNGSCVSPKIGRRSTPFSTSDMTQDESAPPTVTSDGQPESFNASGDCAAALQNGTLLHTDFAPHAVTGGQSHDCQPRPYLTCCVRLSPEKEPHRCCQSLPSPLHCSLSCPYLYVTCSPYTYPSPEHNQS